MLRLIVASLDRDARLVLEGLAMLLEGEVGVALQCSSGEPAATSSLPRPSPRAFLGSGGLLRRPSVASY
jgi:hypothetical protein